MRKKGNYLIYSSCFVLGVFFSLIISALTENEIVISVEDVYTLKQNFWKSPSVDNFNKIEKNTLKCMCIDYDYTNFIYYWVLKDCSFTNPIARNEQIPFHHSIYKALTDSSEYFSPNDDVKLFGKQIMQILQEEAKYENKK